MQTGDVCDVLWCDSPKNGAFCSNGHDGTMCYHCGLFKINGNCPKGYTSAARRCSETTCAYLAANETCPLGHDGTLCDECSRLKTDGYCPKQH